MSTESLEHHATESFPGEDIEHEHKHPTDATYVKVAAILAALTALEVSTYFLDFGPLFLPVLLTLMTIKFLTVVAYFMAGIRLATISTIGLVTVTALIGLGGLGQLINDGLQRDFRTPLVVGSVLSVLLAFVADVLLLGVQRVATPWTRAAG